MKPTMRLLDRLGQANPDIVKTVRDLAAEGRGADHISRALFREFGIEVSRTAVYSFLRAEDNAPKASGE